MSPGRKSVVLLMALGMSASAHAADIQITMENLAFSPVTVSAKVGDTVEWVNKDVFVHSATARNGDWDVTIPAKKTVQLVLSKPGEVDYYCRFHPNMKGTISITP